jgi:alanyl-tRNA synthetase
MPLKDFEVLVADKPELLKEVKEVFDQAAAVLKVKEANADLTKQREAWEKTEKDLKDKVGSYENQKKDLETQLAEAKKQSTIKPDEAVVRGLQEQIANLTKAQTEAKAREDKAIQEKRLSDLNSKVIGAAGKAINPAHVLALMKTEELVGLKEDGSEYFYKLNEKSEKVALSPAEAVEDFLKKNGHLEKGSGNGGGGGNPKPPPGGGKTESGLLDNPEAYLK